MEEIVVHGGQRLTGNVHIEGAKNAVLPILAASLLASSGQTHLSNVPVLSDVFTMNNVLKFLNTKIDFDEINKTIDIDASRQLSSEAPFQYVVHGGQRLTGNVHIEGAKNAVLPILAASLLASSGQTHLSNVPVLSDVFTMNNVLKFLNTKIDFDEINKTIDIDASRQLSSEAPFQYVSKMRASMFVN
ncbi:hypothetical protein WP50_34965 [Lactiplantibacillus plantarum]|nr:hypothetical protein WP50_34965 [Lactiplantibacillus plantarum]